VPDEPVLSLAEPLEPELDGALALLSVLLPVPCELPDPD
jgi:hypothetical protein